MATQKSISMARQIKEDLALRGLTMAETFDSSGNPVLTFGTVSAGNQCGTIRVKAVDTVMVDGLGQNQRVFCPHVIQLIVELSATSGISLVVDATKAKVLRELEKHGTRVEVYTTANSTAPSLANITASPAFVLDNLWAPLIGSM